MAIHHRADREIGGSVWFQMNNAINILVLEANLVDAESLVSQLKSCPLDFVWELAGTKAGFVSRLSSKPPDLIISDFMLPGYSGMEALASARSLCPAVPFIFYSGITDEEAAVEAIRNGATDFILKQKPQRVVAAVLRALQDCKERNRRKTAEHQVQAQAQLLDLATDAIMVISLADLCLFWNQGAERLYGFTREQVDQKELTRFIFPRRSEYSKAKAETLSLGEWSGELEQKGVGDRKIFSISRWTLVRDAKGHPERILVINTDITERKHIETQFLRSQRLESIGALASGIAHDLNNILAPILMGAEHLRSRDPSPMAKGVLETIHKSASRGADLVKQMLSFVRGSADRRTSVRMDHLIREVAKVSTETFPKTIQVVIELEDNLGCIQGDPTQLHQVLLNLFINARDAMPRGGVLTVAAQNFFINDPAGVHMVRITVEDTGAGIPEEIVDKIFDPFFTTKGEGKGTGLGLSTVLTIVKSHRGHVNFQSKVGVGTYFEILIPAQSPVFPAVVTESYDQNPKGHGEMLLVVEDEPEIRNLMRHLLSHYGYDVITAEDGNSGVLQYFRYKHDIQLVLLDMMMPGLDGNALSQLIRSAGGDTKILAMTGLEDVPAKDISEADGYLKKPFSNVELLQMVHKLLHMQNGSTPVTPTPIFRPSVNRTH